MSKDPNEEFLCDTFLISIFAMLMIMIVVSILMKDYFGCY